MKLNKILLGVCASVPLVVGAQSNLMSSEAQGFLTRGKLMYGNGNYVGAIDQLQQMMRMQASPDMMEEAQFVIAMSNYQRGSHKSVKYLYDYITAYPASARVPEAWKTIGDYYFFNEQYEEAIVSYDNVDSGMLDGDSDDDLRYRWAYAHLREGNYDLARNEMESLALSSSRYREAANFYKAYIKYANGDYDEALADFKKLDRDQELGYFAQYYASQIYFKKGDYEKAASMARQLQKDDIDYFSAELHRLAGESEYQLGNDDDALKELAAYEAACEDQPMRSSEYALGVINFRQGNYEEAVSHLGNVVGDDDALSQSAYLYIGQSSLKLGELNSASMAFEKAINMDHDSTVTETAFYNYAITQNEGGRSPFNKSIDMFESFINRYPNSRYSSKVEEYLVNAYLSTNDYDKALTSISHIKNPSDKMLKAKQHVLYNLGVQELSNSNVDKAISYFNQSLNLGSYDASLATDTKLWLAECQYRKGDYATAEANQKAFLSKVSAAHPNVGMAYYDLGYSQFQQRHYGDALGSFEKAVGNAKLDNALKADAYNRIGDANYYSKQYATAEKYYDKAYNLHSSAGDYSLFQMGEMLGLNKQYADKVKKLDKMLADYPNSSYAPSAMLEKANAYVAMNNTSEACNGYSALVAKYPSTAEARMAQLQLAITERNAGKQSAAIESYKKVISKYPSSDEAKMAAEDLKLIYADLGKLGEFAQYINNIPNGPRLDVSEMERLTFEAAEKQVLADKPSVAKMNDYLKSYPNGSYAANAHYYIAKNQFQNGKYADALTSIDKALAHNDASFAEDALAMKSEILMKQGNNADAIGVYQQLEKRASTNDTKIIANLGIMRASKESGKWKDVEQSAATLMGLGGLSAEEENEVTYNRAYAAQKLGNTKDAETHYATLAKNPRSEWGAKSAYELARLQYSAGNLKKSEATLNSFIDAGTPHQYWLAKGFILLADIYHKKGSDYEAIEYLESLKANYPGKEADITKDIDSRLTEWKAAKKAAAEAAAKQKSKK